LREGHDAVEWALLVHQSLEVEESLEGALAFVQGILQKFVVGAGDGLDP
jgi:hypothetical protein